LRAILSERSYQSKMSHGIEVLQHPKDAKYSVSILNAFVLKLKGTLFLIAEKKHGEDMFARLLLLPK
jgi:hypothetical protein